MVYEQETVRVIKGLNILAQSVFGLRVASPPLVGEKRVISANKADKLPLLLYRPFITKKFVTKCPGIRSRSRFYPILEKAVRYLYYKDELKPADAIVVLAGEETERC